MSSIKRRLFLLPFWGDECSFGGQALLDRDLRFGYYAAMFTGNAATTAEREAWCNHYGSEDAIRSVVNGLLDGTWPEPNWKHREHCVATLGLILYHPEMDLDHELPGIIQRYNLAQGGQNTDSSGYHHSITVLYLNAIRHFAKSLPPATSPVETTRQLLQSPMGKKDYPLRYYSRKRIMSKEARLGWVEPDVAQPAFPIQATDG